MTTFAYVFTLCSKIANLQLKTQSSGLLLQLDADWTLKFTSGLSVFNIFSISVKLCWLSIFKEIAHLINILEWLLKRKCEKAEEVSMACLTQQIPKIIEYIASTDCSDTQAVDDNVHALDAITNWEILEWHRDEQSLQTVLAGGDFLSQMKVNQIAI